MAVAEEKKRIQVTLPLEIWRDLDDCLLYTSDAADE